METGLARVLIIILDIVKEVLIFFEVEFWLTALKVGFILCLKAGIATENIDSSNLRLD